MSAEQYGAELGGKKGNVTFIRLTDATKSAVPSPTTSRLTSDYKLPAPSSTSAWQNGTNGVRPEIHAIINQAFNTDKEGQVSVGRVLQLRRLEISDDRWKAAMEAIRRITTSRRQQILSAGRLSASTAKPGNQVPLKGLCSIAHNTGQ